jgi:anhydro-N-acetylmuramic acid kinase
MSQLQRLGSLHQQPHRTILGLMSGTSIDGLDLALCRFSGSGNTLKYNVLHHHTVSYNDEQRCILRNFATADMVSMEELCIYHTQLSLWHADMVMESLQKWNVTSEQVDLIASHGQTIRHAPIRIHKKKNLPNATFQLGEADHLAVRTGIVTVSDLRQKHVAAGGEGAPLAVYGDQLLFQDPNEYRILLNIGGISNLTVLDPGKSSDELALTFDTGPGNTLMDLIVRQNFLGQSYDVNGELASKGNIIRGLLNKLKEHDYFVQTPPKTTGPELLSESFLSDAIKTSQTAIENPLDLLATLNQFTAETIVEAILHYVNPPTSFAIYVSGGGAHNDTLMRNIKALLPQASVNDFMQLGVHPDAKEALFFAALANELVCGRKIKVQNSKGELVETSLGKISLPN